MRSKNKKLIQIRNLLNMTQAELGEAINLTQSAISNYDNGHRKLPVQVAQQIIKLAKVRSVTLSLEDFF
jgi:transcriptional regulator with XRE-family HTH domain